MGAIFALKKNERITSKLLLGQLFSSKDAKAVTAYPIRAVALEVDRHAGCAPVQILFSVSKRHFKHAVDRNRVKRQLREAYRLNKGMLPDVAEERQLLIAFIWIADDHFPSHKVSASLLKALDKICKK